MSRLQAICARRSWAARTIGLRVQVEPAGFVPVLTCTAGMVVRLPAAVGSGGNLSGKHAACGQPQSKERVRLYVQKEKGCR